VSKGCDCPFLTDGSGLLLCGQHDRIAGGERGDGVEEDTRGSPRAIASATIHGCVAGVIRGEGICTHSHHRGQLHRGTPQHY
jgi:hypothetical protein